jgi:hypothetical protein
MYSPTSTDNCEPPFAPAFVAREVGYLRRTSVRLRSRLLVASASIEIRPAIIGREEIELGWIFRTVACRPATNPCDWNLGPSTRNSQLATRNVIEAG